MRAVRVALVPAQGRTPLLDYAMPGGSSPEKLVGARVVVPLGNRRATGIVIEALAESEQSELREISVVVDDHPVLDASLLRLCRWLADYYLVSLGDALEAALPGSLRAKVDRCLVRTATAVDTAAFGNPDRIVLEAVEAAGGEITLASLRERAAVRGFDAALKRLVSEGALRSEERLVREHGPTRRERVVSLSRQLSPSEEEQWRKRRPALHSAYMQILGRGGGPVLVAALRAVMPDCSSKLRTLQERGVARIESVEVYRELESASSHPDTPVELTAEQAVAAEAVSGAAKTTSFAPFLLLGVTGSGKTEVYLRAIEAALNAGRTALVLVPEISLTHQLVDRVRSRFARQVAVLHSGLSEGERWDEWRRLARGEARIAVGARSAVYAPLPDLGLVVVDEEHDGAYKQEEGVRYNARDVAVVRAQMSECAVVLGSATPSMESFSNGTRGRYRLLELTKRVEGRPLPVVEIVDLRRRLTQRERGVPLTPELVAGLQANQAAHGQSLVFLNRRGFASFLQCSLCGETLSCPNCSVALTWHLRARLLRCHHCDHVARQPLVCPSCKEPGLQDWGAGTEQLERVMADIVPGARVGRMDRDTTSRRGSQRAILKAWREREFDILVGTQMITKGHDIPGVTFVGVVLADQSLNFPDFRAAERTFQLLTQVAGRAGRGERPGRVLVQTFQPKHYSLACAANHDFRSFAEMELEERRGLGYPPFARLALLRCDGEQRGVVERVAKELATAARAEGVQVLGPASAPVERVRQRFQWHVLLRSAQGTLVRRAAAQARDAVRDEARRAGVRVLVDIDPYSML